MECVLIPCTHGSATFKDCTLPRTFHRCQLTRNSKDAVFQIQILRSNDVTDTETGDKVLLCPSLFQTAMLSLLGYRRFIRFLIVALSDMALACCWIWHYVFRIASIMSSLPLPVPLPLSLPIAATFSVANHGKFM